MRYTVAVVLLALLGLSQAFINGTLLPPYLCAAPGDGLPKSLGGVLPYLTLGISTNMYNQFPPGNGTTPIETGINTVNAATGVVTLSVGHAVAPPAAMMLGAFHNGQAATNYVAATTNPAIIVPSSIGFKNGTLVNYKITPGAIHTFAIVTNAPGFNNAASLVDGFFVYAMDTVTGQRIGKFLEIGTLFHYWAACDLDGTNPQVGIAHSKLINVTGYTGVTWMAPASMKGTVKFVGAAVSDGGFGPVAVEYNTTTNSSAPALSTVIKVDSVNAGLAFTALTPMTTTTTATAVTFSPGVTTGIALGTAGAGIALGCGAAFFYAKKRGS